MNQPITIYIQDDDPERLAQVKSDLEGKVLFSSAFCQKHATGVVILFDPVKNNETGNLTCMTRLTQQLIGALHQAAAVQQNAGDQN